MRPEKLTLLLRVLKLTLGVSKSFLIVKRVTLEKLKSNSTSFGLGWVCVVPPPLDSTELRMALEYKPSVNSASGSPRSLSRLQ